MKKHKPESSTTHENNQSFGNQNERSPFFNVAPGFLNGGVVQKKEDPFFRPATGSRNDTGLPGHLKSGVEALSGVSLDAVKVHSNSPRPVQLNALAYAQGTDIYLAPGQERHLPHEAWHVAQQAQGRVQPTTRMKNGVPVNDDQGLEQEADVMGTRAMRGAVQGTDPVPKTQAQASHAVVQAMFSAYGAVAWDDCNVGQAQNAIRKDVQFFDGGGKGDLVWVHYHANDKNVGNNDFKSFTATFMAQDQRFPKAPEQKYHFNIGEDGKGEWDNKAPKAWREAAEKAAQDALDCLTKK